MPRHLEVYCGDTTCFDPQTGNMCRFVYAPYPSREAVCSLHRDVKGNHMPLGEYDHAHPERANLQRTLWCLADIK